MWQEAPATPDEAFAVSVEGAWYAEQLATARAENRIIERLPVESAPVNTFWDIGRGDMTTIWFPPARAGGETVHRALREQRQGPGPLRRGAEPPGVRVRAPLPAARGLAPAHRQDADSNQTIEESCAS